MNLFQVSAVLLTLAAVLGWLNQKYLRLPPTIGLMALALLHAGVVLLFENFLPLGLGVVDWSKQLVESIHFDEVLLEGMLAYLLFAGALHVDLGELRKHTWVILVLSTVGVVVTTVLVGGAAWCVTEALGLELPLLHCFLFGALIAPTDPIAVLAIMKSVGAPKSLETKLAGESLFNDGVGVVVFLALAGLAEEGHSAETPLIEVAHLFAVEAGGGLLLGLILGGIAYLMMGRIDDANTEILITVALVTGGYALAGTVHASGPLVMVVAGLVIGNHGRRRAMSPLSVERLDAFWELVDELLNAVLFVLIGIEVLVVSLRGDFLLAGLLMVPLVLLSRYVSVAGVVKVVGNRAELTRSTPLVITWAGLRGGISIALALSLRDGEGTVAEDLLLTMTYVVVACSILGQGLTVAPLLRRLGIASDAAEGTQPPTTTA